MFAIMEQTLELYKLNVLTCGRASTSTIMSKQAGRNITLTVLNKSNVRLWNLSSIRFISNFNQSVLLVIARVICINDTPAN